MFDHERLDVYRVSMTFVAWAYRLCKRLKGFDRHARDQLLRSSQSIPLNIAEGNGKPPSADRNRFFRIALGSALECAATIDVLIACEAIDSKTGNDGKRLLVRIVSMLVKMSSVPMQVRESSEYAYAYEYENEYDNDNENE
ncbi:four helix bundle protein [Desulfatitalea alkaliphila]|uniref:Four helix bundle protein n=1 Tax=Desulfatitalea alkaliphila TaxID=2929485 RepID=A0AA41R140_9BACT|nr:four helix bundle protein [Desulfatitalea alkaliphila]MCJ8499270.1 four helix bundle protein [Desulfatitalea alkaliphila]